MRTSVLSLALGSIATASVIYPRQEINWDIVDANPEPTFLAAVGVTAQVVTYPTAAIQADATNVSSMTVAVDDVAEPITTEALRRRAACAAQPTGASGAPKYSPDNASAFAAQTSFGAVASAAPTPSGYSRTFVNLAASNNAYGYLGFTTLQTYDTNACAARCNKISGCLAINIYFERDPSQEPGAGCENPPSYTMIKCVFWGGPVDSSNAVNNGQWRSKFQVAIAGSNGYISNSIATPPGYLMPRYLGNAAINAPYDTQGFNTYMGSNIFPPGPFNIQLCADFCNAQTKYNTANPPTDGSPVQTCQFFNTYLIYINTTAQVQGQYCAIYSEAWAPSYATNVGQNRGSDRYLIMYSFSGTNATNSGVPNKSGAIYQARRDINWPANNAGPYCSNLLGFTELITTTTSTFTTTPTSIVLSTQFVTSTTALYDKRDLPANRARATPVAIPEVLIKYPASVVSSACAIAVTSPTSTSTITEVSTVTAAPTFITQVITVSTTVAACKPVTPDPFGDWAIGIQCDTAPSDSDGWGEIVSYSVTDLDACRQAFGKSDYGAAATFDSSTKICTEYAVFANPAKVKKASGTVFLYWTFLFEDHNLQLAT